MTTRRRRMFGQMSKWVAQIDDAARIPEFSNRAYATATPGPALIEVRIDPEALTPDASLSAIRNGAR